MKSVKLFLLLCFIVVVLIQPAGARVAVLVHGVDSFGGIWEQTGIVSQLQQSGWRYRGRAEHIPLPDEVLLDVSESPEDNLYTLDLPPLLPFTGQAAHLSAVLQTIVDRHPGEPLILVGHSTGGVISRLALVSSREAFPVTELITIASPHSGSPLARKLLSSGKSSSFCKTSDKKPKFNHYGTLDNRFKQQTTLALMELLPHNPTGTLGWLNHQPHPDIAYTSIIRNDPAVKKAIVPVPSQDMNFIPALSGRSRTIITHLPHELVPADGKILADLLRQQKPVVKDPVWL